MNQGGSFLMTINGSISRAHIALINLYIVVDFVELYIP